MCVIVQVFVCVREETEREKLTVEEAGRKTDRQKWSKRDSERERETEREKMTGGPVDRRTDRQIDILQ